MRICSLMALSLPVALLAEPPSGEAVEAKTGILLQSQFESVGDPVLDGQSQNLFLRRANFMGAATLGSKLDLTLTLSATDFGKATENGTKKSTVTVLDAFGTYRFADNLFLDAGWLRVPWSHNGLQTVSSLLGQDYSPYSYAQQLPSMGNPSGRDGGIQGRGFFFENVLDVRLGLFQGRRLPATPDRPAARNALRTAARVQANLLDPETSHFYRGSYFGAKRVLSFGVAHDRQDEYRATTADGFLDLPFGGDTLTVQASHYWYDGGAFLDLPKQKDVSLEASWTFGGPRLSPVARYESRRLDGPATSANWDESHYSLGLAWWIDGFKNNVKAFYTRIRPESAPGRHAYHQVNVQWQLYAF